MNYANQNHRVGGQTIKKVASAYDVLATSNRESAPQLHITDFSPMENEQLRAHLTKTASAIQTSERFAGEANGVEKKAFLTGGMDLFTRAKGLLTNKLGVPEEVSHQLASPVVTQALKIQGSYGGDEGKIMERLVDEMQGQLTEQAPAAAGQGIGLIQQTMAVTNTKSLEEHIKHRLIQEVGLNNYEADRMKKIVVGESRDLATMLRPHKMDVIANAIVDLIIQQHDPSIAMNIKDSQIHLSALRSLLPTQ